MDQIEITDETDYKIKVLDMKPGEVVECPDKTSTVEKVTEGCKITLNKSCSIKKL